MMLKNQKQEPDKDGMQALLIGLDHHDHIDETAIFKTSVEPPQKLDSSAIVFSSPKKKDLKHRRRKVDVDRIEEKRKRKTEFAAARKFQSEKDVELIQPYGTLDLLIFRLENFAEGGRSSNPSKRLRVLCSDEFCSFLIRENQSEGRRRK